MKGVRDMRFMGFSSKVGRISASALALAFVVSLGVVSLPAEAQARKKKLVWSVKVVCFHDPGDSDIYGNTVVNIHNITGEPVNFNKKFIIALRENAREAFLENPDDEFDSGTEVLIGSNIGVKHGDTLAPNDVIFEDCVEFNAQQGILLRTYRCPSYIWSCSWSWPSTDTPTSPSSSWAWLLFRSYRCPSLWTLSKPIGQSSTAHDFFVGAVKP